MEDVSREDFLAWWESKTGCAVDDTTQEEIKQAYDNHHNTETPMQLMTPPGYAITKEDVDKMFDETPPQEVSDEQAFSQLQVYGEANPAPDPLMVFQSNSTADPNTMTISSDGKMCVELNLETGDMTYGEHYVPSDAAKIFWDAVQNNSPAVLRMENEDLKAQLDEYKTKYGDLHTTAPASHYPDHCHGDNGKMLPQEWHISAQANDAIRNGGWKEDEMCVQYSNEASHLYHLQDEGMNVEDWASYYSELPEEQMEIQMFYADQNGELTENAIVVDDQSTFDTPGLSAMDILDGLREEGYESPYERAMKVVE